MKKKQPSILKVSKSGRDRLHIEIHAKEKKRFKVGDAVRVEIVK